MALLQMDQGDMENAHRIARQVLAESPDNTHASIVAGTASIEAQEIESACSHLEQVLAREPDNARAWLGVGLARLYQQRHEQALVADIRSARRVIFSEQLDGGRCGIVRRRCWFDD